MLLCKTHIYQYFKIAIPIPSSRYQDIAKPINIEKKNKSPSKQTLKSLIKVSIFQRLWRIDVVEDGGSAR